MSDVSTDVVWVVEEWDPIEDGDGRRWASFSASVHFDRAWADADACLRLGADAVLIERYEDGVPSRRAIFNLSSPFKHNRAMRAKTGVLVATEWWSLE